MDKTDRTNLRFDPALYARLKALKSQGEGSMQDNINAAMLFFLDGTRPGFRAWLRKQTKLPEAERDVAFLRLFAREYEKALSEQPDEQPPRPPKKKGK